MGIFFSSNIISTYKQHNEKRNSYYSFFWLYDLKIETYINKKNFSAKIYISNEKDLLLDTGGGVLKGTKEFKDSPFFVINPDTLWSKKYLEDIKKLEEIFYKNKKPSLLIVNKKLSLDTSFTGDFNRAAGRSIVQRDERHGRLSINH